MGGGEAGSSAKLTSPFAKRAQENTLAVYEKERAQTIKQGHPPINA